MFNRMQGTLLVISAGWWSYITPTNVERRLFEVDKIFSNFADLRIWINKKERVDNVGVIRTTYLLRFMERGFVFCHKIRDSIMHVLKMLKSAWKCKIRQRWRWCISKMYRPAFATIKQIPTINSLILIFLNCYSSAKPKFISLFFDFWVINFCWSCGFSE